MLEQYKIDTKDISVVVQGAIDKEYTPKCLKSIRKYLPNAQIILSTWENSDVEGLDYDIIVLNKDPGGTQHDFAVQNKPRSMNNFNRQLVSTQNGLKKANKKYILKLRTDLVLTSAVFLKYWDEFSVRNDEFKIFNHRVLASTTYSREYSCQSGYGYPLPFHTSDFWLFGEKEDILNYFKDCPLQTKEEAGNWNFKYPTRCPYETPLWRYAPEQQFGYYWAKKHFKTAELYDWSDWNKKNIELSNNILYNNFTFLGFEQSGIYSKKHEWAFNNENSIQGLISFKHFEEQYKQYCDKNYEIKKRTNYKQKLKIHYDRFIKPFLNLKSWVSEIFSVIFYLIFVIFKFFGGNNDKK